MFFPSSPLLFAKSRRSCKSIKSPHDLICLKDRSYGNELACDIEAVAPTLAYRKVIGRLYDWCVPPSCRLKDALAQNHLIMFLCMKVFHPRTTQVAVLSCGNVGDGIRLMEIIVASHSERSCAV
jgi:hypothetical protein